MAMPAHPKIYHIVHLDRLPSIIADGCLWCDAQVLVRVPAGTAIGMSHIKERRLKELTLTSYPDLHVGDCVPFYFCPRSVMLYLICQGNHPELDYHGGQEPILHLQADLHDCVVWAEQNQKRWAFTLSNAGARYFEDRCDLNHLHDINWQAVQARDWQSCKEGKQAEFLLEDNFPWHLVECVGVQTQKVYQQVVNALPTVGHRPTVNIKTDWYY
jgi:hypothetical protein